MLEQATAFTLELLNNNKRLADHAGELIACAVLPGPATPLHLGELASPRSSTRATRQVAKVVVRVRIRLSGDVLLVPRQNDLGTDGPRIVRI